jgi:hypothetical protein
MIEFIAPYTFTQLGTTGNTAHFPVHRSTRNRFLSLHQPYPGNGFIALSLALQITHRVLFSQPKSLSCPYSCDCQFRRLDSIQFLCSQAHIPAGWRLEARSSCSRLLFSTTWLLFCSVLFCGTLPCNHFARTTQKTASTADQAFLPRRCLARDVPLFRAFPSLEMCLASRCLAMSIHVTFSSPLSSIVTPTIPNTGTIKVENFTQFVVYIASKISTWHWPLTCLNAGFWSNSAWVYDLTMNSEHFAALTGCSLQWRRNMFPVRYKMNKYYTNSKLLEVICLPDCSLEVSNYPEFPATGNIRRAFLASLCLQAKLRWFPIYKLPLTAFTQTSRFQLKMKLVWRKRPQNNLSKLSNSPVIKKIKISLLFSWSHYFESFPRLLFKTSYLKDKRVVESWELSNKTVFSLL